MNIKSSIVQKQLSVYCTRESVVYTNHLIVQSSRYSNHISNMLEPTTKSRVLLIRIISVVAQRVKEVLWL